MKWICSVDGDDCERNCKYWEKDKHVCLLDLHIPKVPWEEYCKFSKKFRGVDERRDFMDPSGARAFREKKGINK